MIGWFSRRALAVACTLASLTLAAESGATTITLRSGNAPINQPDPPITFYVEPSGQCAVPFANAFTAADFTLADTGPVAWSIAPAHGAWGTGIPCDPAAGWVSTALNAPSRSALYSIPFFVDVPAPCCIQNAKITLCWMADDLLGDAPAFGGPNPIGVYVNGVPTTITGGNYATQTIAVDDITGSIHCGLNHLYLYDRDAGCAVSGIIFQAKIDYFECTTPTTPTSWGRLRAAYR